MASNDGPDDTDDFILTFSLDYGTTKIRVSFRISRDGEDPDSNDVDLLELQKNRSQISSRVAFVKEPTGQLKFHWGEDFLDVKDKRQLRGDEVFELHGLKLCLYPTEIQGSHKDMLQEQLDKFKHAAGRTFDTTPETVIQVHLREIRARAMDAVVEHFRYRSGWTRKQLEKMSQRWSFSVPELATLATNQEFTQMIKAARYPKHIMLMTETEAAAAWKMHEYSRTVKGLPGELKVRVTLDPAGTGADGFRRRTMSSSSLMLAG